MRRRTPLRRSSPPARSQGIAAKALDRDWTAARRKVASERVCRFDVGGMCDGPIEAAHVIGRAHEARGRKPGDPPIVVDPLDVVPLCKRHHTLYDQHSLDVLPVLTIAEQARAVSVAGGLIAALRRTTSRRETP